VRRFDIVPPTCHRDRHARRVTRPDRPLAVDRGLVSRNHSLSIEPDSAITIGMRITLSGRLSDVATRRALVLAAFWWVLAATSVAAAPWDMMGFNRVEADPNKTYRLSDDNGPWMILAVTFSGDEAESQARELVLELRKRYKMPAFLHPMEIDLSDAGTYGIDAKGNARKMRYQRGSHLREIAVLIGNYPAVDDVQAQRDLKKVKYMHPDCLEIKAGKKVNRPLAALRTMQQQIQSGFLDDKKSAFVENVKAGRGPMANAFVTTNPLLPRDYYVAGGVEHEIIELNQGVKYSLLDCPKRYSVKVATFSGSVVIDQRKIKEIESGKQMPSKLVEAAENAHEMTELLRKKGYEAYEFHDPYSSIVCVGSFDSVAQPGGDGRTVINPAVLKTIEAFAGQKDASGQLAAQAAKPRTIKIRGRDVPFDLQPLPVEVPRRSIAQQYQRKPERF
jgi:hypothetical protein